MPKLSGETYRNTRLCVDSYEKGVLKGRCYNPGFEGGKQEFESLAQFLTGAEVQFDSANIPQSFTAKRSFLPWPEVAFIENLTPSPQVGKLGTFTIRLLFRQHASWQGSIIWMEGNREQTFRSVLELVLLIDSALGGCWEDPT